MKITLDGLDDPGQEVVLLGPNGRPLRSGGYIPTEPMTTRSLLDEAGAGGIRYFAGFLFNDDELNAKMAGREGVALWNKMRRTDAKVDGLINTIKLPIKSATWEIDFPKDDDPARERTTEEHLDFAREQLFRNINWTEYLEHALTCVWAGFSFFEKVYQYNDKRQLALKKVAPRLASTLWRWLTDHNELTSIEQRVWKDNVERFIQIPREKLVLIVYRQEANSYEGLSILRAAYKHYLIKDTLYKIDAIRLERYAIGIPVITLPEQYNNDLYRLAQTIGKNWRGGQQSFVIKVQGMEIDLLQMSSGGSLDLIPTIKHHDEQIPMVALAQFMSYGTTQTGSRALGEVSTEFFYDSEIALANLVIEATHRDLLWPTMDLNFPDKPRPRIVVRDIGAASLGAVIDSLAQIGVNFITPTRDLENHLRERLDLPALGKDEEFAPIGAKGQGGAGAPGGPAGGGVPAANKKAKPEPTATGEGGDNDEENSTGETAGQTSRLQAAICPTCGGHHEGAGHVELASAGEQSINEEEYWRPLRPIERFIALRQIKGRLMDARDDMMRVLLAYREEWSNEMIRQLVGAIPNGPEHITDTKLDSAEVDKAVGRLMPIVKKAVEFGETSVVDELEAQARDQGVKVKLSHSKVRERTICLRWLDLLELRNEPLDFIDVDSLLTARVKILVGRMAQKTQEAAWQLAASVWRTMGADGVTPEEMGTIKEALTIAVERDAQFISSVSVSEAMSLGRDAEAQRLIRDIDFAEYSAILDSKVCRACAATDGRQMQVGSKEYYQLMPPLSGGPNGPCEGRGNCRCIFSYSYRPLPPGDAR